MRANNTVQLRCNHSICRQCIPSFRASANSATCLLCRSSTQFAPGSSANPNAAAELLGNNQTRMAPSQPKATNLDMRRKLPELKIRLLAMLLHSRRRNINTTSRMHGIMYVTVWVAPLREDRERSL